LSGITTDVSTSTPAAAEPTFDSTTVSELLHQLGTHQSQLDQLTASLLQSSLTDPPIAPQTAPRPHQPAHPVIPQTAPGRFFDHAPAGRFIDPPDAIPDLLSAPLAVSTPPRPRPHQPSYTSPQAYATPPRTPS
jgi:hypothetical protein